MFKKLVALFKNNPKPQSNAELEPVSDDSYKHKIYEEKLRPTRQSTFERVKEPEYVYSDQLGDISDYLGAAAEGMRKAKLAIKEKRFDDAWSLLHCVKDLYMKHVQRGGFTEMQAFALDATVHEHMANILRMEKKHNEALVHLTYWIIAQKHSPKKRHGDKFRAYFERCKFTNVATTEAWLDVDSYNEKVHPYSFAQAIVSDWTSR